MELQKEIKNHQMKRYEQITNKMKLSERNIYEDEINDDWAKV